MTVTVRAHPSLALIKYWGKSDVTLNLPATSSLAVGLEELYTDTTLSIAEKEDQVFVDSVLQPKERYAAFFDSARKLLKTSHHFRAESHSNFPAAAGLASSSSGFAALAYGCALLIDPQLALTDISNIARQGSASAARAIFGGFTSLEKEALHASPFLDASHWPELRVLVAIVTAGTKSVSSREAMERTKRTSPLYSSWLKESDNIFSQALSATQNKDLNTLGTLMQKSYLQMFSTMFTCVPPIFYWQSESLALIKSCEQIRIEGISVWETMDAGPQVKILCLENDIEFLQQRLSQQFPQIRFISSKIGGNLKVLSS